MNRISKTQAAYLTGLVDGEGSIFVQKVKAKDCKTGYAYRSGFAIAMTKIGPLFWCKLVTGVGKISEPRRHKRGHLPGVRWSVWSNEARLVLKHLIPYLLLKAPNAENLIAFQDRIKNYGSRGAFGLSKKERRIRDQFCKVSKKLNHRGT